MLQSRALLARVNYLVAAAIGVWSIYLMSMPLHPQGSDVHGGLLAVFSGFLLVPVALSAYVAGLLHHRKSEQVWIAQTIAVALVAVLIVLLVAL